MNLSKDYYIGIDPVIGEFIVCKRVPMTSEFIPIDYFKHAQDFIDYAQTISEALRKYSEWQGANVGPEIKSFIEGLNLDGIK
jgi:hypothetical protein